VAWDGENTAGVRVASGVYRVRIELEGQKTFYKKVAVVR
jgi:hypothetical protein